MSSDPNSEDTTPIPKETLNRIAEKEAIVGCFSLGLYAWDLLRYFSHQPKVSGDPFDLGIPRQTGGIAGLIDQNMGDLGFTLALIYVSRIPVEIGAKIYEAITDKKVNPRIKLSLAVLMGMAYPTAMELGIIHGSGNTKDPLDLFGVIVAGAAVSAGYEVAEFLSTRPPHYLETKFTDMLDKIKPIAEDAVKKINDNFPLYINPATRLVEIKPRRPQDTKRN